MRGRALVPRCVGGRSGGGADLTWTHGAVTWEEQAGEKCTGMEWLGEVDLGMPTKCRWQGDSLAQAVTTGGGAKKVQDGLRHICSPCREHRWACNRHSVVKAA